MKGDGDSFQGFCLWQLALKRAMSSARNTSEHDSDLLISLLMPECSRAEYWLLTVAQYLNK
jgi:hypothetical protein